MKIHEQAKDEGGGLSVLALTGAFGCVNACGGGDSGATDAAAGADSAGPADSTTGESSAEDVTSGEPLPDGATSDALGDASVSPGADGGSDGSAADTSFPDASTVDAGDSSPPDSSDAGDASNADAADSGAGVELVSPAVCPWAVALASGHVYWTETTGIGSCGTPAIRGCATTGCATLPLR